MTLILSGTDGLSDVDGSAATPAVRGTDTNTGIFFPAADTIGFAEGGVEVARITNTGAWSFGSSGTATGTNGQVLTSGGSGAAPTWTAPSTGAMTLISTTTASSSANVLFTGLSTTYTTYLIIVSNAVPANNGTEFRVQLSTDSGGSYVTTPWYMTQWYSGVGGATGSGGTSNAYVRLLSGISNVASDGGISATIYLHNPGRTNAGMQVQAQTSGYNNSSTGFSIASGTYQSTAAINAANLLFSSGNITSGVFKLYGIS